MNDIQSAEDNVLLIQIGKDTYALPVSCVEGIVQIKADAVSPVPFDMTGRIRGIFNHRGTVTVLINCKGLKTQTFNKHDELLTAVILNNNGKKFAILVDRAHAVVDKAPDKEVALLNVNSLYLGEKYDGD